MRRALSMPGNDLVILCSAAQRRLERRPRGRGRHRASRFLEIFPSFMMTRKVLSGLAIRLMFRLRVSIDQQQVGQGTLFHHDRDCVGRTGPAIRRWWKSIFSSSAGVYQRVSLTSWAPWRLASAWENSTSVPNAVLSSYRLNNRRRSFRLFRAACGNLLVGSNPLRRR